MSGRPVHVAGPSWRISGPGLDDGFILADDPGPVQSLALPPAVESIELYGRTIYHARPFPRAFLVSTPANPGPCAGGSC